MKARLTFLGTGTSQGVPIVGCNCERCSSPDPADKRLRASALVEYGGLKILIDCGPDFRAQMLRAGVGHLDAIFLTHAHMDHIGGFDDIRSLNYTDRSVVQVWCEERVLSTLKTVFGYAFAESKYPGAPEARIHLIDERPFVIYPEKERRILEWVHDKGYALRSSDGSLHPVGNEAERAETAQDEHFDGQSRGKAGKGVEIIPVRGMHDKLPVLGFRFGDIAYITDMSLLPEGEFAKLKGLKHLTLNTVGYKKHHSHFSLDEVLELSGRIGAQNTWLTHLSHTFPTHEQFSRDLEELCRERGIASRVRPAFDGLVLE